MNGLIGGLDFGQVLKNLKNGKRANRAGWNGKDMYIELQIPDENSKMKRAYIFMKPVDEMLVPWVASQTDLIAEDWFII